ncbi:hypothetical protein CPB97_010000 [Podila verticillata]|nr:hypothetical protein CPB97_010000 [Podila verticillata]
MLPKPISLAVALATNALTIVLAGSVHNHCKQPDIEKMVVFGDSYSNTGNVAKAKRAELMTYAFGSATSDSATVQGLTGPKSSIPVPGFLQQIESYYLPHNPHPSTSSLTRTLFVVHLQGNEWSFDPTTNPQTVVDNLERGIRRLAHLGATRFLFFKNQDYGLIPFVVNNATTSQLMSSVAKAQSQGEQAMLAKLERELESQTGCHEHGRGHKGGHPGASSGIDIRVVDIAEVYTRLREPRQMGRMGITDLKRSCVSLDYVSVCKDPKEYFYFDGFHVTTVVHQQIAKAVLDVLDA